MGLEMHDQSGAMRSPLLALTEGIQLKLHACNTERLPETRHHDDDFCINVWTRQTKGFNVNLVKLPIL
jgi:hypothetical protein